jgi:putative IMPACT (imprinted ancient) family translation regulator
MQIGDHVRCSDDGEPGGTAGRPMLSALTSSGLDHIMVVVTRYFGGIKLGTGGLVRAYGKVTTECLKDARTITIKPKVLFLPLKMQVWNSCKHFQTLFQSRMCVMLSDFLVAE